MVKTKIKKIINFLKKRYAPRGALFSFSQAGEDILIKKVLKKMGVTKPTYIDIGAHHPIFGNNTYLFYKEGTSGLLVEPNESLCAISTKKRKRDKCACVGVGIKDTYADFFHFSVNSTRSTFSKSRARQWETETGQSPSIYQVPILSLDTLITKYFAGKTPDIISIDAEGSDLDIILSLSWRVRPKVFCIETAENSLLFPTRNTAISDIMEKNGYKKCAETPANTIFADTMDITNN